MIWLALITILGAEIAVFAWARRRIAADIAKRNKPRGESLAEAMQRSIKHHSVGC